MLHGATYRWSWRDPGGRRSSRAWVRVRCVSLHSAHFSCHFEMATHSVRIITSHLSPSSPLSRFALMNFVGRTTESATSSSSPRRSGERCRCHALTWRAGGRPCGWKTPSPSSASFESDERVSTIDTEKSPAFPAFLRASLTH